MGWWIVGVMPNNGVLPPPPSLVGPAKVGRANEERFQCQEELIQNLMQSQ
jgi:hypothetical protein